MLETLFKIQILTQADNQNQRKKCSKQRKLHSKRSGLKISKPYLQHFTQNSILEEAKVTE